MDTDEIAPEAASPAPPPTSSKAAWIVAGVATAAALVAAMVAVSVVMRDDDKGPVLPQGLQAARFDRPVAGTITSVGGTSFEVKESFPNGETQTTTVKTDRNTTFRESVEGKMSDLRVGDTIAVSGTTADDVLTATHITETATQANVFKGAGRPFRVDDEQVAGAARPRVVEAGRGNMRLGEIAKIEGDTITLASFDGEAVTVKTTADTAVRINETITLADLKKGDEVRVVGSRSGDEVVANEVIKAPVDESLAS